MVNYSEQSTYMGDVMEIGELSWVNAQLYFETTARPSLIGVPRPIDRAARS